MTTETQVIPLARHQAQEAGDVLGRAFFDDPVTIWILPGEAKRRRVLPWFFRLVLRYGERHGVVHTTAGSVQGAAAWLPPERPHESTIGLLGAEALFLLFRFRPGELVRALTATSHFERLHKRDAPARHWYLSALGVDPPCQGKGLGGDLLQPVLARADREGLPCYTETAKEINVAFYRKHRFEVVVEGSLPRGGPRYWTLLREPGR